MTTKFEAAKLKRELKMSGINYEFKRLKVNDFGEPIPGVNEVVATIKGLYHEQNSNIQITTGDTTQVRTKKIPMVLCLYDDAALAALRVGDVVKINNKTFKKIGRAHV